MAHGKITKKQRQTLSELEELARSLGLKVSYGRLKFAGLKLKGGQCLFKGEKWVVMDRKQPFEDQVEVFRTALNQFDLTEENIPAMLRGVLASPAPPGDAGSHGA